MIDPSCLSPAAARSQEAKLSCCRNRPLPATEEYYCRALALYRTTDLSVVQICRQTSTSVCGFRSYIHKYHRRDMLARYGIDVSAADAAEVKLRSRSGQTPATHAKYRNAILACDSSENLSLNISQIAREFGLNPTSLANQLRVHYPEILEHREMERRLRGLDDNLCRGVRPWCIEQYAAAVERLYETDETIEQVAEACNVSSSGLREHVLFYHKDLVKHRADSRERGKNRKTLGRMTGSGTRHEPQPATTEKYLEAVRLYRTTSMTVQRIAEAAGVSAGGLSHYMRTWYPRLVAEHRGFEFTAGTMPSLSALKVYRKAAAEKYAAAIERLRDGGLTIARAAAEFGLNADSLRFYLREHEPELHARLGRMTTAEGRSVLRRSAEKYAEAIHLYETTPEPLRSIARRLGLNYKSLGGYIRRNHPKLIECRRMQHADH